MNGQSHPLAFRCWAKPQPPQMNRALRSQFLNEKMQGRRCASHEVLSAPELLLFFALTFASRAIYR